MSINNNKWKQQQMEATTTVDNQEMPEKNESTKSIQTRGYAYSELNEH